MRLARGFWVSAYPHVRRHSRRHRHPVIRELVHLVLVLALAAIVVELVTFYLIVRAFRLLALIVWRRFR